MTLHHPQAQAVSSSGPASSSSSPPASLSSVLQTLHSTYTQQQEAATAPTFQFATPPPPFPTVDLPSPNNVPSTIHNVIAPSLLASLEQHSSRAPPFANPTPIDIPGASSQTYNAPPVSPVSNTNTSAATMPMSLGESTSADANEPPKQETSTSLPVCNILQFSVNLHFFKATEPAYLNSL